VANLELEEEVAEALLAGFSFSSFFGAALAAERRSAARILIYFPIPGSRFFFFYSEW
jgi:alpha/beta superfamily hydrolase